MSDAPTPIADVIARADRLQDAADRAFARWMNGYVATSSAAMRLQNQSDDANMDVRFHPDYDPDIHGAY